MPTPRNRKPIIASISTRPICQGMAIDRYAHGLVVIPDDLSPEQSHYVADQLAAGFPVIFTTPEGPGPVVAVDNTHGIRQASTHLRQHGWTLSRTPDAGCELRHSPVARPTIRGKAWPGIRNG
jgi:DNA-binding LacI/PurR family transcriptional regulator